MKIYTKYGDAGETSLWRSGKVSKSDPRIEAIGAVDEVNAHLGLCIAAMPDGVRAELAPALLRCQRDLFEIGAELADGKGEPRVAPTQVERLEREIDAISEKLPPLARFILPGGSRAAALLHVARTVARRAERALVSLHLDHPVSSVTLAYINRLSDYLFVAARYANALLGVEEPTWSGDES